ncbi:hypothetical protein BH24ACT15_BH24ACT15_29970 [soil metagenome]
MSAHPTGFTVTIEDQAFLDVADIWPDGDAPDNPTVADVIDQIHATSTSASRFAGEWGFDLRVDVDGTEVKW